MDADLVLVEYSINGYGGQCQCFTAPQNAGYETLVRKVCFCVCGPPGAASRALRACEASAAGLAP